MDLNKAIKQAIQIIKLDKNTISDVASDPNSTTPAIVIVILAGIAAGIGSMSFIGIIISPILYVIAFAISVGFIHLIARLFGGKGELMQYLRATGHVYVVSWISIIPILGPIISFFLGLWALVVNVVIVKSIYKLSTLRAVIVVLLPVIIGVGFMLLALGVIFLTLLGSSSNFGVV